MQNTNQQKLPWTPQEIRDQITAAVEALGGKDEILSPDQRNLDDILRKMKKDPEGFLHLDTDGIYRSIGGDRDTVIDAVPFTPGLVKAMLDRTPYAKSIEDRFRGVDGRRTPEDQWWELPRELKMSERERNEVRRKGRETLEELKRRKERGELVGGCGSRGVKKVSDYNIEV